ncbi:CYTH domain-containing protein [Streptomyces sp. NPDC057623]|uniref:CYTH domain-containing protein n=1 Tax=Streptomyces sp. NPDC057623 TaxID=3346187 RepID=UPI0036943C16
MTNLEIERKFKIEDGWEVPSDAASQHVRQAYLTPRGADPEIRVRAKGAARVLTVKAAAAGAGPLVRREVEFEIAPDVFEQLWKLSRGDCLDKRRWNIPYEGRTVTVDVYEGPLAGLRVAEIEFDSVDEAGAFEPPEWFGAEVTGDPAWSNRELAAVRARSGAVLPDQAP